MSFKIKIKNYRCFHGEQETTLDLHDSETLAILGKNNTGKSTLMRIFFELKHFFANHHIGGPWIDDGPFTKMVSSFSNQLDGVHGIYGITDATQLFPNHSADKPIEVQIEGYGVTYNLSIVKTGGSYEVIKRIYPRSSGSPEREKLSRELGSTFYLGAHRNLVNQSAGGSGYYDLHVGTAFVDQWDQIKNGGNAELAKLANIAEELVCNVLEWDSISINKSHDSSQIYINKNKERFAINELGTGVAELVICLISAAIKKPSWIFIDEPESHLHPSLQVKFLDALEKLATNGVVFSTHSIGLARTAANRILFMEQSRGQSSRLRSFEDVRSYPQLLGEMQFSQFHELGANKVLFCEGVTDIRTIRQWLRLYGLESSILLVPLGGRSMIDSRRVVELEEFKRLGISTYVLIDSERTSASETNTERTEFIETCRKLFGEKNALQTERRATENYFTDIAIKAAMRSDKYKALDLYECGERAPLFWGKNNNWKIAAEMKKEDLAATDIGVFLESISK